MKLKSYFSVCLRLYKHLRGRDGAKEFLDILKGGPTKYLHHITKYKNSGIELHSLSKNDMAECHKKPTDLKVNAFLLHDFFFHEKYKL